MLNRMAIQIGQPPDHGFDEPLGLLRDCHRRIEHFLQVLIAVADEAEGGALSPEHRGAAEGALRYFSTAAPKHTADEEESLFPRLRDTRDPGVLETLTLLEQLERDHEEADQHHTAVEGLVRRWLANRALAQAEAAELRHRLARLQCLYRQHIALENDTLFPAAARALDPAQLRDIGREMARRRHVLPPVLTTGSVQG
jgi:hemerythrin-like domain-containing protein